MTYKDTYENLYKLTDRERKVLFLIGGGLNNQSISERMYISVKTVKSYINDIHSKTEIPEEANTRAWLAVNYRRLI